MKPAWGWTAALLALMGCAAEVGPARPQALVFIDTDLASPEMADRVRIEILRGIGGEWALACGGCSREVAIESAADWPLSFGVEAPAEGERRWVHATLFAAGRITGGRILPESAIEALGELSFGQGVMAQEVFLGGACAGIPAAGAVGSACVAGELTPVGPAPARDPEAPSRVGTFDQMAHGPCTTRPTADSGLYDEEACIEGGTYWMGDVRRQGFGGGHDGVPEHLVTVSPFFLDRYEYTVGRYESAVGRGFVPVAGPPGGGTGCHWPAPSDGSLTAHPLNCVTPALAEELCAFEGRRLPTEAEREWAAGNGTEERLFPWSDVLMRPEAGVTGPVPVGSRPFDVTDLGGIHDLGWNLAEWVADDFQMYTERCWTPGRYGIDPLCRLEPGDTERHRSVRGGYWIQPGDAGSTYYPMAPTRRALPPGPAPFLGFRCARSDRPRGE